MGEDDEREGGAAGEGVVGDVVDDGVNNEEGGAFALVALLSGAPTMTRFAAQAQL